jgi:outer membrane protein assembly factor BamB
MNAFLAVHPKGGDKKDLANWQLSALQREDGREIWTIDLTQRPVWEGLSIAADGSILVAMWDGSLVCLR